jgi:hypothetical protein
MARPLMIRRDEAAPARKQPQSGGGVGIQAGCGGIPGDRHQGSVEVEEE